MPKNKRNYTFDIYTMHIFIVEVSHRKSVYGTGIKHVIYP